MAGGRIRGAVEKVAGSRAGAWYFINVANRVDRWLVPATRGVVSTAPGEQVLVVETIGAKSGAHRRIPLVYALDGDDIVLVASKGGAPKNPAWFYNLRAHPEVDVWARGRSGRYRAREAVGAERERLWKLAAENYGGYDTYQGRTGGRVIPVVVLERVG